MNRRALRTALTPGLIGFLASPRVRRRPYALFSTIRRLDPVHASPIGVWLLSSHTHVASVLRDARLGNDERKADVSALNFGPFERFFSKGRAAATDHSVFLEMMRGLMLFRDPPDHTRLRTLVTKAFTPRRVEALAPRIEEIVDETLDRAERTGHMDVMSELAYPVPARVICELVGVPAEDHHKIIALAPGLAKGLDPSPMRTPESLRTSDAAARELTEYLDDLIVKRRADPRDDLLSALIAAEDEGSRLTRDELIGTVGLLIMAGHETTANLIGNGLLALLRDRPSFDRLREDPSVGGTAIEELLRYDSPVQMTVRVTLEPIDVGSEHIPAGRIIVAIIGAANRDPSVFHEPNKLDLARSPNPQLAFSGGAHFCLGAPLARLEGRIVLGKLVGRFPDMKLAGATRRNSFTIRGLSRLDVAWR